MAILGQKDPHTKPLGPELHNDLVTRWSYLISCGLSDDDKKHLCLKYPPPENFQAIASPKLNPIIEKAISNSNLQRDRRLAATQDQIAAILACVGQLFTLVLAEEGGGGQ